MIKIKSFKKVALFSQNIFLNRKQNSILTYRMSYVNFFADSFVDRCSEHRKNKEWIQDKLKHSSTNFILFHIDKPFVIIDDTKKEFNLCKLNYSQVEFLLKPKKEGEEREDCIVIFLGLEYKRLIDENNNNGENLDQNSKVLASINNFKNSRSPYLTPDQYDRNDYKPWFAIDTSKYDLNHQNIENIFQNGTFLQGNFIRMLSMEHREEASLIAQVRP
jgi:hypothetical protein